MTDVIVRARGVGAVRAGRTVLQEVDLDVRPASSLALVGPSGSGKSTLLALIAGLEQPDTGTIERTLPPEDLGLVLQGHGLVSLLTAEENAAVPLQAPGRRPVPRAKVRRRAHAALAEVGLTDVASHLVEALSGGQQQRVAVARALVTGPALLIADEPTAALDAENREHVADLLFALPARGTAVLIATHDRTLAARADLVLVVDQGRVLPA
ncbi:ABC transporter ATP-binding protein [Amnibacterium kyonggiense]|uniref:Putative ABC transport system ATP-binding protein/lipoprotein-releasing system ATP-binding protein n=1 Tax=Amnibacterium kyonggiense TaxID=595671 RepID=A0A4R7FM95_9MICO|nr:ATP-binding cassette domain-containing protein [Amnibacterium kyonggiense]TDS77585.1 putative ABC transport system ATP-binding protein/lipoprotein-releasing system ATP-binding protein [Amnibacterium kyonggiense]